MKPVQDLSNEELLREVNMYKPWDELTPEESQRRFELGKELNRRIKDKSITIT